MSEPVEERRGQFGAGPLSRAAALIYAVLVVEFLLLLTTLPGLIGLVLLDRDASNVPLVAVCALPVGPAVSAALYAFHRYRGDLTDLAPGVAFWRGYRANLAGALRVWVPCLAWLAVIAVSLANRDDAGVPAWWVALLVVVAVAVTVWGVNALVITSLFVFRTRDVARLAAYFLVRTPSVPLGSALLLLAAAGVTAVSSEAVLALLGSMLTLALLVTSRPMINKIRAEFTA
ncbi:hypothetical protein ACNTMW_02075 [Planosporangium sp. 12N6]|uniref:hypothetical protein n=1 Tax=Planosporangium spinosum TaxID=3402278 RepID=UPI003CF1C709